MNDAKQNYAAMAETKPAKNLSDLPEPKLVEGNWKFWQGHYVFNMTIKHHA